MWEAKFHEYHYSNYWYFYNNLFQTYWGIKHIILTKFMLIKITIPFSRLLNATKEVEKNKMKAQIPILLLF